MNAPPISKFLIFADDSVVGSCAAYGLIGVVPGLISETVASLNFQKVKFGATGADPLHCKEIFNPEARSRSAWAHLEDQDVADLCWSIASDLSKTIKPLVSIGFVNLHHMPMGINLKVPFEDLPTVSVDLRFEKDRKKQALAFAFPAALRPFDFSFNVAKEDCLVTLGRDTTKIAWLNRRRRQAHHAATDWASGFNIQIGHHDPMLELADIVAYFGAHLLSGSIRSAQAKRVLDCFSPRIWKSSFTPGFSDTVFKNYPSSERLIGLIEDVTTQFPLA